LIDGIVFLAINSNPKKAEDIVMRKSCVYFAMVSALALVGNSAIASTSYGTLNNFDTVNDTGQECHGFEIELDDVHKTDINAVCNFSLPLQASTQSQT
jgi:hypothetical protein